jgi:hypothetical protein
LARANNLTLTVESHGDITIYYNDLNKWKLWIFE